MARSSPKWLWIVPFLVGAGACTRTLQTKTVQPNPMLDPASPDLLRVSQRLYLDVGDMDLPRIQGRSNGVWTPLNRMKLRNSAYFAVVSRERLRFHVKIVHKWEEFADPVRWNVRLVDDRGRVFYPELKERWRHKPLTRMWDHEHRTGVQNRWGDVIGTRNDGWRRRVPLEAVSVFEGRGDYTFRAKDLLHPGTRKLTLVMNRSGVEYRFEWQFGGVGPGAASIPDQEGDWLIEDKNTL
jgi:hypothetical protein